VVKTLRLGEPADRLAVMEGLGELAPFFPVRELAQTHLLDSDAVIASEAGAVLARLGDSPGADALVERAVSVWGAGWPELERGGRLLGQLVRWKLERDGHLSDLARADFEAFLASQVARRGQPSAEAMRQAGALLEALMAHLHEVGKVEEKAVLCVPKAVERAIRLALDGDGPSVVGGESIASLRRKRRRALEKKTSKSR
jgi:hypothetical protein